MVTKMRYCDTVAVGSTAGAIGKYIWRVNDCFDPDYTSTGHQPLYRDTYASLYDFYTVHTAVATVTFVNPGSVPAHCGVLLDEDVATSTAYTTLMEQNTGQHKLLPAQNGSLSTHTFTIVFDAWKMFGWDTTASLSSKTLWANTPNVVACLLTWIQPVDLSSTVTYYVNIEIDMTVQCSDLQTPTGS